MPQIWPGTKEDEKIWNSSPWKDRREKEQKWFSWYDSTAIKKSEANEVDQDTGERIKMYPLALNPIAKMCRIHRSVMIGMFEDYTVMPVQLILKDAAGKALETQQQFVKDVWYRSNGPALLTEGSLLQQVHGGHVYKVNWEPTNILLPYRMRVEGIPSWQFYPVFDKGDYWNLREGYIGYMISGEDAEEKYGIKDPGHDVLYLEQWTRDFYQVTVAGIVPEVEGYGRLEGEHGYGRVPIVYIPHYRDGDFYGPSLVDGLIQLCQELNGRAADYGDAVIEVTHQTMIDRNIDHKVTRIPIDIDSRNIPTKYAIYIGSAKNMVNSHEPNMDYPKAPDIPSAVREYIEMLWQEILRQSDVSSVLVGMDDTASGRITGPVTGMRSVGTIQHCQVERIEFSTGLIHLTDIMLRMALAKQKEGAFEQAGVKSPGIIEDDLKCQLRTLWPPMVPVEVSEKVMALNSRMQVGGISLPSYLAALGEPDIEGEIARIQEDAQMSANIDIAKIEAQSTARAKQSGGDNAQNSSGNDSGGRKSVNRNKSSAK